jgi:predicted enzyme related to lactoylglutathione lyase
MTSSLISNIGGTFIYSENPQALADWYKQHLDISFEMVPGGSAFYASFDYNDVSTGHKASVAWSIIRSKNRPTHVKEKHYMINYRVFDADKTAAHLRSKGIEVKGVEVYPEGKFAWCSDPEGNELELWEDTTIGKSK